MKKFFHPKYLPWFALAMGAMCAGVRWWLFATGTDSKGMLLASHPGNWLVWLITAVAVGCLTLGTRNLTQAPKYSFNFPSSILSAVGAFIGAAGMAVNGVNELIVGADGLSTLVGIFALVSTVALGYLGMCRLKGIHPSMVFHTVICIYLMLQLVSLYRMWSSDPQIQDYCFALLATVSLMLGCYYNCAFDVNSGVRRSHALLHLLAVYFCIASLPHNGSALFYLSGAVWMFTGICNLTPMPREAR